jgi:hypothetical protein
MTNLRDVYQFVESSRRKICSAFFPKQEKEGGWMDGWMDEPCVVVDGCG